MERRGEGMGGQGRGEEGRERLCRGLEKVMEGVSGWTKRISQHNL